MIDEFLSNIDKSEGWTRRYFSYETFVLHLLKAHIESQGKTFLLADRFSPLGDAIAPKGFDEFSGNTLIEVRYGLPHSQSLVEQLARRLSRFREKQEIKNLLLISYRVPRAPINKKIIQELQSLHEGLSVTIWGSKDLDRLAQQHVEQAQTIANNLFSLRLQTAVNSPTGDWLKEREERLAALGASYESGQFSLFLGAGVSTSAGMPQWNTLLNSLFVTYLTKEFDKNTRISDSEIKQIVERLGQIDAPSALMAARYLRKGLAGEASDITAFAKTITDNLYDLRDKRKKKDSDLISAISNLCMPKRTGARIDSVVTYNFDDLIENHLANSAIQCRSIFSESDAHDPDELPIYHVHGFLPEAPDQYEGLDKSTLVFSEEGYHQIYGEAYHWSNLVQLGKLRSNTCLMIGLSMNDPNLRRLLDISARSVDSPRHFAFLRRIGLDSFIREKDKKTGKTRRFISNRRAAEQFLDRHHSLNEQIMKELGVTILWIEEFDDIPTLLKRLL